MFAAALQIIMVTTAFVLSSFFLFFSFSFSLSLFYFFIFLFYFIFKKIFPSIFFSFFVIFI